MIELKTDDGIRAVEQGEMNLERHRSNEYDSQRASELD
jgi:hypothetical protein